MSPDRTNEKERKERKDELKSVFREIAAPFRLYLRRPLPALWAAEYFPAPVSTKALTFHSNENVGETFTVPKPLFAVDFALMGGKLVRLRRVLWHKERNSRNMTYIGLQYRATKKLLKLSSVAKKWWEIELV